MHDPGGHPPLGLTQSRDKKNATRFLNKRQKAISVFGKFQQDFSKGKLHSFFAAARRRSQNEF
jgi:hypothetical protein